MDRDVNQTTDRKVEVAINRFQIPFKMKWVCAICQKDQIKNAIIGYISESIAFTYTLNCVQCDEEQAVNLNLHLELDVVKDETSL